jgi:hypothetical protein
MRGSPGRTFRIVTQRPERRRSARVAPHEAGVASEGVLRPGLDVQVLNISRGGALLASPGPLRPEAPAELLLRSEVGQYAMHGHVAHCWVECLAPLRFLSRLVFDGETGRVPGLAPAHTARSAEIVIDLRDLT